MEKGNLDVIVMGTVVGSEEKALEWLNAIKEDKAITEFAILPGSIIIGADGGEPIKLENIFAATPEILYGKSIAKIDEGFLPIVNIYDATLIILPFANREDVELGLQIIDEIENTNADEADRLIALMAANLDKGGVAAIGELAEDESGDYVDFARKVLSTFEAAKATTDASTAEPTR